MQQAPCKLRLWPRSAAVTARLRPQCGAKKEEPLRGHAWGATAVVCALWHWHGVPCSGHRREAHVCVAWQGCHRQGFCGLVRIELRSGSLAALGCTADPGSAGTPAGRHTAVAAYSAPPCPWGSPPLSLFFSRSTERPRTSWCSTSRRHCSRRGLPARSRHSRQPSRACGGGPSWAARRRGWLCRAGGRW